MLGSSFFISKGWGGEEVICNNEHYCGKILTVYPNKWCSYHSHKKIETMHCISGSLKLEFFKLRQRTSNVYDNHRISDDGNYNLFLDESVILLPGQNYYIDSYRIHRFTANTFEPCRFIEFSQPHVESEVIRYIKGD